MKRAIRAWLLIIVPMLLVILSADLIYLWAIGVWYDPVRWIEYAEVGILVSFILLGIWSFYQTVKGLVK